MTDGAANAGVIAGIYAPIAADYEEIWAPLLRPYGLRVLDAIEPLLVSSRRVLELGCGVGRLLPDIAQRAPDATIVAADLTEGMLRLAPSVFPRVAMDASRLGFAPASFDAVVSCFALFHLPDPPAALPAIRETIRPAGAFATAVWGTGEVFPAMTTWNEELDRLGVPEDPAEFGPGDGRASIDSPEKFSAALAAAGFVDVRAESIEWFLRWDLHDFLQWRLRMGPSRRRLEQLHESTREEVVSKARAKVASLGGAGLVHRDEVVLASARTPG